MGKEIYPSATKAWNCSFPILFSLLPKRDHSALSKHVVRLLKKSKTKLHFFFCNVDLMLLLLSCHFNYWDVVSDIQICWRDASA